MNKRAFLALNEADKERAKRDRLELWGAIGGIMVLAAAGCVLLLMWIAADTI